MPGSVLAMMFLAALIALLVVGGARDHRLRMSTSYGRDMRLFRSNWSKLGLLLGLLLFVSAPAGFSWLGIGGTHLPTRLIPGLPLSEFWLSVMFLD